MCPPPPPDVPPPPDASASASACVLARRRVCALERVWPWAAAAVPRRSDERRSLLFVSLGARGPPRGRCRATYTYIYVATLNARAPRGWLAGSAARGQMHTCVARAASIASRAPAACIIPCAPPRPPRSCAPTAVPPPKRAPLARSPLPRRPCPHICFSPPSVHTTPTHPPPPLSSHPPPPKRRRQVHANSDGYTLDPHSAIGVAAAKKLAGATATPMLPRVRPLGEVPRRQPARARRDRRRGARGAGAALRRFTRCRRASNAAVRRAHGAAVHQGDGRQVRRRRRWGRGTEVDGGGWMGVPSLARRARGWRLRRAA